MSAEIARRDFLKAAAAGAAGIAAASVFGGASAFAEDQAKAFEGKKKFAGIGSIREVTDDILYVGASDRRIQLFKGSVNQFAEFCILRLDRLQEVHNLLRLFVECNVCKTDAQAVEKCGYCGGTCHKNVLLCLAPFGQPGNSQNLGI